MMAQSGAAMIIMENSSITPAGSGSSRTLRCDHDRYVDGLAKIAATIKEQRCRAALQINHAGRFAALWSRCLPQMYRLSVVLPGHC